MFSRACARASTSFLHGVSLGLFRLRPASENRTEPSLRRPSSGHTGACTGYVSHGEGIYTYGRTSVTGRGSASNSCLERGMLLGGFLAKRVSLGLSGHVSRPGWAGHNPPSPPIVGTPTCRYVPGMYTAVYTLGRA